MPETAFALKIVTPDKVFFEGPVVYLTAPGTKGYFGVLRNHAPLVSTLEKGKLSYRNSEGKTETFSIEDGFLEVLKNKVLVLTDKILKESFAVVA